MIVVDNNILVHFWLPYPDAEECDALYRWDSEWVAPILWKSEFRNVMSLYVKKGLIDLSDALQLMEKAEFQMKNREFHVNSIQVISLAQRSGCSAYDCEYVGLAEDFQVKLITYDKQILRLFPKIAFRPNEVI